jgi:hypothetical protein
MDFTIDKLTYADGLAYRYHIRDEEGELLYIADRSGMLLPSPTRLVEFFDPGRNLAARLQPPDLLPWQRATRYEVLVGDETEPYALVHERLSLVDLLLLRMPRYTVEIGEHRYSGRATRYGARLCELAAAPDEEQEERRSGELEGDQEADAEGEASDEVEVAPLEQLVATDEDAEPEPEAAEQHALAAVERPPSGAGYLVTVEEEEEAAPLREDLLALASLAILIDVELFS